MVALVALGIFACALSPAPADAAIGVTIEQCANARTGTGDCTGSAWITGNLNPQHSLYREGDFVPVRGQVNGLEPGTTYTLRIGYDAVESGLHAYDYLGSVDSSENAPGQRVVPCENIAGTAGPTACGNAPSTLGVPTDPDTHIPSGSQLAGVFSAGGGVLTDARYVQPTQAIDATTSGTVARQIDVTFRADGDTVVIAWGAHIASSLDWGAGRTFVGSASGSPFHVRVLQIVPEGGAAISTGNRELSLQGSAIAPTPSPFTTSASPAQVAVGDRVVDTAFLGGAGSPPTGVVQFFVCFGLTAPPDCTTRGTSLGPGQVVISISPQGFSGTASTVYFPLAPGQYCFRAEYQPDATAPYSPAAHTDTTSECVQVTVPPPTLTLTKICVPENDPGLFNLLVDSVTLLVNAACGDSIGPRETTAGPHTVSETAGTGTSLAGYAAAIGGSCAPDGTVTLAAGDSATCTITNTRLPSPTPEPTAALTVNKVCSPVADPGRFDLHVDEHVFADVPCGGTTGRLVTAPGAHTVRESGGSGTSLTDYTTAIGGDCAPDGTITLANGADAVCTVTNTRKPPERATLTVNKLCVPAGDDGRFNLTIDGDIAGDGASVRCGGTTGEVQVRRGVHTVGETAANGTDLGDYRAEIGGDCSVDGSVTVGAGDQAVCTITNIRETVRPIPATLTVDKVCVPADDGGSFDLHIDGTAAANKSCGDRLGPLVVPPGRHTVRESAGTGTSLADYTTTIGGACAADGAITLAPGASATCTITNARSDEPTGTIEIENVCLPEGLGGQYQLELDRQQLQNMRCGESTGPIESGVGDHLIAKAPSEAPPSPVPPAPSPPAPTVPPQIFQPPVKTVIRGDCTRTGKLTLRRGRHVVCFVIHRLRRPKRPPKPPPACYQFVVTPKTFVVGVRVTVVGRITLHRRPVLNALIHLRGLGASRTLSTARNGEVRFRVTFRRAGIVRLTTRRQFGCPKPPERNAGVAAATTTPLTG